MELTGKIIAVLPERSGTSQRTGSEWRCASYVLETTGDYPRRMNFEVFGSDRIAQFNIQQGELLTISFDIDARESNGRWFNQIRAFRVDRGTVQPAQVQPMSTPVGQAPFAQQNVAAPFPPVQPTPMPSTMSEDEQLPF